MNADNEKSSLRVNVILFDKNIGNQSHIEENENNAKLIADAGTTANKCGKLPSQLLQENEEMKAMLEKIVLV